MILNYYEIKNCKLYDKYFENLTKEINLREINLYTQVIYIFRNIIFNFLNNTYYIKFQK